MVGTGSAYRLQEFLPYQPPDLSTYRSRSLRLEDFSFCSGLRQHGSYVTSTYYVQSTEVHVQFQSLRFQLSADS